MIFHLLFWFGNLIGGILKSPFHDNCNENKDGNSEEQSEHRKFQPQKADLKGEHGNFGGAEHTHINENVAQACSFFPEQMGKGESHV